MTAWAKLNVEWKDELTGFCKCLLRIKAWVCKHEQTEAAGWQIFYSLSKKNKLDMTPEQIKISDLDRLNSDGIKVRNEVWHEEIWPQGVWTMVTSSLIHQLTTHNCLLVCVCVLVDFFRWPLNPSGLTLDPSDWPQASGISHQTPGNSCRGVWMEFPLFPPNVVKMCWKVPLEAGERLPYLSLRYCEDKLCGGCESSSCPPPHPSLLNIFQGDLQRNPKIISTMKIYFNFTSVKHHKMKAIWNEKS